MTCCAVQAPPARRKTAITEPVVLLGPPPTLQAIAASPCESITKSGFDAPGMRSCGASHAEAGGRSAVHTPFESVHTAVAKPPVEIRTAGKTEVVSRAGETSITKLQLPPLTFERDQSWSCVVRSSQTASELPSPSMAAAASQP